MLRLRSRYEVKDYTTTEPNNNRLKYHNPPVQTNGLGTNTHIASTNNLNAMSCQLVVQEVNGPIHNGVEQGLKYIQIGFIQNIDVVSTHAVFTDFVPAQERWRAIETLGTAANTYTLDTVNGSEPPWYDTDTNNQVLSMAHSYLEDVPAGNARTTNVAFYTGDRPKWDVVEDLIQSRQGQTAQANAFVLLARFHIYFAVQTNEIVNKANEVYTQRAKAQWQFDGSRTLDNTGRWTQTGAGNSGDEHFIAVQDGTVCPITTGTPFNTVLNGVGQVWDWRNH